MENYICEKQASITKECMWYTNLKFNAQTSYSSSCL